MRKPKTEVCAHEHINTHMNTKKTPSGFKQVRIPQHSKFKKQR